MRFSRKFLFFAAFLLVIYATYFITHITSNSSKEVLGTNTSLVLFEEPDSGREPILQAIKDAKKEVLVEVYLLSDKQVLGALEEDASRGISVKVMLEEHPFGGGNNKKTFQELESSHVPVKWTNSVFALTHEKAIIIDGTEAFILNQNLTTTSFSKNREYDIEDTNPVDVGEVRAIFIADWERSTISITDDNLVVSPINSRERITSLIQSATKRIDMEIEDINDARITEVLSEKAKTIDVYIIAPTLTQISSNKKSLNALEQSGAKVKMISSPYIHAKLIIVDDKKAYIGSINLSSQSMDENRELGILISQSDIIEKVSNYFAQDWGSN